MEIREPKSFEDLLKLQKILDIEIDKPRENGFKQRYRTDRDIRMSIIAEIVEFNEETKRSHKTWKEKEFNEEKMKEEAVDILFFFLQNINRYSEEKNAFSKLCEENVARIWEKFWTDRVIDLADEFDLIIALSKQFFLDMCVSFAKNLVSFYKNIGMTKKEVYKIYFNKWQKNMKRIEREWTR